MQPGFETLTILLLAASAVAILCRRLRLPYTVGLVVAGIALAAVPFAPHPALSRDLLFTALLPPLLFEGAYHLHWKQLRRDLALVTVLATVGVLITASIVSCGLHGLLGWTWSASALFGSLIAATDPVSVIAAFKEAKAEGRLQILIEAESLFNDGTAAVLFAVVLAVVLGKVPTAFAVGGMLIWSTVGGILCGLLTGAAALLLCWRAKDHLVEIAISAVAAWGSFLLADALGASGVLSTLAAGILLGNFNPGGALSVRGRQTLELVWEFAAFVANSIVFLLIGVETGARNFAPAWAGLLLVVALVLIARAATVFPCCAVFAASRLKVTTKHQLALFWGGLRGALALALALSLPEGVAQRREIEMACFGVVAFSIFAEGLSMTPLLRRIGEIPSAPR